MAARLERAPGRARTVKVQSSAPDLHPPRHVQSAPHLRRSSLPGQISQSPYSRPVSRGAVHASAPESRPASRQRNPDVRGIVSKRRISSSATDLRSFAVAPLLVEKHRHVPRHHTVLAELSRRHSSSGTSGQDWFTRSAYTQAPAKPRRDDDADANGTGSTKCKSEDQASWSALATSLLAGESPRGMTQAAEVTNNAGEASMTEQDSSSSNCQAQVHARSGKEPNSQTQVNARSGREPNGQTEVHARSGREPRGMENLRNMEDVRDRHNGFSDVEVSRMQQAFVRYLPLGTDEVGCESLRDILIHLGYLGVTEKEVDDIAQEISGFSTWSFDEFQEAAERAASNEHQRLLDTFEENSNDQGKMNIQQLIEAMKELEMGPLKATIREILPCASGVHQGLDRWILDLDAFLNFMAVYRIREGLTSSEVLKAREVYDEVARRSRSCGGEPTKSMSPTCYITVSELSQALLDMFGPFLTRHVHDQCNTLPSSDSTQDSFLSPGREKNQRVAFHEFVIWARRVRTSAISELWEEFEFASVDDDGLIPTDELHGIMRRLDFTLSKDALDEFIDESGLREDERIDIDRFVTFVDTCQRHGGFSQKDLDEFARVFAKFDYDKSEEIEKLEFLDLLRYLGYTTSLEDVDRFLRQADSNGNGGMDFSEFVWLMRLHRETELKSARRIFNEYCDSGRFCNDGCETLSVERCKNALNALVETGHIEALRLELLVEVLSGCPEALCFEDFVVLVDKCRHLCVTEKRRRAGFSDKEFQEMRKSFEAHVKPGSKTVEKGQFLWIVAELGLNINSQAERRQMFTMLDDSRCAARDAGVEPHELGELGSQSMTFWDIVHFLHLWRRQYEGDKVTEEEKVIDELRFSRAEVTDFRDLFMEWVGRSASKLFNAPASDDQSSPEKSKVGTASCKKDSGVDEQSVSPAAKETRGAGGRRSSMSDILSLQQNASSSMGSEIIGLKTSQSGSRNLETSEALLPIHGLRKLLCSIGLDLNPQQCTDLDSMIMKFLGRRSYKINFVTFLRVMRWMLDTNFADINGAAQRSVEKGPEKSSKASRGSPTSQTSPIMMRLPPASELPMSPAARRRNSIA